jgi:hypothetical protein
MSFLQVEGERDIFFGVLQIKMVTTRPSQPLKRRVIILPR